MYKMPRNAALAGLVVLMALTTAQAYPHLWAMKLAPSCNALPMAGAGCHKNPQEDTATSITVTDLEGNPVKNVCASKTYSIQVDFPEERLAYVSLNAGKVAATNAANKKCANTMSFSKKTGKGPAKSVSVRGMSPASGDWEVSVVSASGACEPFMVSKATVPVAAC